MTTGSDLHGVPDGYLPMAHAGELSFSTTAGPFFFRDAPDDVSSDNSFWVSMRVEPHHLNLAGICHGGALLAFADELLGATIDHVIGDHPVVTVDLGVQFLAAARPGELIEGRGEMIQRTGTLLFMAGRFTVGDRIVATTRGVFRYWPDRHLS